MAWRMPGMERIVRRLQAELPWCFLVGIVPAILIHEQLLVGGRVTAIWTHAIPAGWLVASFFAVGAIRATRPRAIRRRIMRREAAAS